MGRGVADRIRRLPSLSVVAVLTAIAAVLLTGCPSPFRIQVEIAVDAYRQVVDDGVIYVSVTSGDDSYPGLPTLPKKSIQAAIDFMFDHSIVGEVRIAEGTYLIAAGDNLLVKNGVSLYGGYQEGTWEYDIDAYPTIVEKEPATSAITVKVTEGVGPGTEIDGLKINGGVGVTTTAVLVFRSSPTIRNCDIDAFGAIDTSYGIYVEDGQPVIEYNLIMGGAGPTESTGVVLSGSDATLFRNVILPHTRSGTVATGVWSINSNPLIQENLFFDDGGGSTTAAIKNDNSSPRIYANIIDGGSGTASSVGIWNYNASAPIVVSNVIYGGDGDAAGLSWGIYHNSDAGSQCEIYNNTIAPGGTSGTGIAGVELVSGGDAVAANNIFIDPVGGSGGIAVLADSLDLLASLHNNAFDTNSVSIAVQDRSVPTNYAPAALATLEGDINAGTGSAAGNVAEALIVFDSADLIGDGWFTVATPFSVQSGGLTIPGIGFVFDRIGTLRSVPWTIGAYEF